MTGGEDVFHGEKDLSYCISYLSAGALLYYGYWRVSFSTVEPFTRTGMYLDKRGFVAALEHFMLNLAHLFGG